MLWRYVKVVKWGTNFSIILNIETIGIPNLFSVFDYFMATQRFEAMLDEWIILANHSSPGIACQLFAASEPQQFSWLGRRGAQDRKIAVPLDGRESRDEATGRNKATAR